MYQQYRRVVSQLFIVLLLGLAAVPAKSWAIGGSCGGATPCECGDQLVASRTLVFGLDPITVTPCVGEGLVIEGVSDLTLDLGGNTIRAAVGASGADGIRMNEAARITVTGGIIAGFSAGIGVRLSHHNHFLALQVVDGAGGISALGDANTVERSVFRRLGGSAIFVHGEGTHVLNNRMEDTGSVYLDISPVDNLPGLGPAVIARNVILRSGEAGLEVHASASILGTVVDRNQVRRSTGDGFILSGSDLRITHNLANDNAGNGFASRGLSASVFDGNRAQANDLFGMVDDSVGQGTAGTANSYTKHNRCDLNRLGDSAPSGLCF